MEAATQEIDQARLEQAIGQAVTDTGAALNGALVMLGGELGLWKALAGAGPVDRRRGRRAQRRARALRARVAGRPGRQRLPRVRRRGRHLHAAARAGDDLRRRGEPGLPARRLPDHQLGVQRPAAARGALPRRRRASAGTSTTPSCSPAPSSSSGRATAPTCVAEWIPALDGVEEKLRAGGQGGRRRLRPRRLDRPDRAGVPAVDRARLRLPRGVDRAGARARRRGGRGRQRRASRSPRRRTSPARATTSSASSTACTTWATRWGRWSTCARSSPRTGR